MNQGRITRRNFLKGTVAAAGTTVAFPAIVPSSVFGAYSPSNRIVMGAIGVGSQGSGDMRGFLSKPEVQMVAVCDVKGPRRKHSGYMGKDSGFILDQCTNYMLHFLIPLINSQGIRSILPAQGRSCYAIFSKISRPLISWILFPAATIGQTFSSRSILKSTTQGFFSSSILLIAFLTSAFLSTVIPTAPNAFARLAKSGFCR